MNIPSLTDRQVRILKAIVEEHIETGEPVGSETLDKKYNLGVSPATIRNEMVALTEQGYLHQPFTSAGRIPTATSLKYYIRQLMEEKDLSVAEEVAVKEKIWDYRFQMDKLLRQATRALAEQTDSIAVATTSEGDVYHAGYANILDVPEFFDIDVTKTVLSIIDDAARMQTIFSHSFEEDPIQVLLGDDIEVEFMRPCGVVFTQFRVGDKISGNLGVVGPSRLNYPKVVPIVKYFGRLVNEIAQNWE
jgi:heat-inducible transcriptional repressor